MKIVFLKNFVFVGIIFLKVVFFKFGNMLGILIVIFLYLLKGGEYIVNIYMEF